MLSMRENPGFYTGLGTGIVLSIFIGKIANAYGYTFTGSENESSDIDTEGIGNKAGFYNRGRSFSSLYYHYTTLVLAILIHILFLRGCR